MVQITSLLKDKEVIEYGVISFLISLAALAAIISLEFHLITMLPQ